MRIAGCVQEYRENSRQILANMLGISAQELNFYSSAPLSVATSQQGSIVSHEGIVIACNGTITNEEALIQEAKLLQPTIPDQLEYALGVLFSEKKEKFIASVLGAFIILVYDIKTLELYIFRDRLGEKGLYWTKNSNGLFFSYDLKSLIASNAIEQRINFEALSYYCFLGAIPLEQSPLMNVYRLLPGYYLHFKEEEDLEIVPYFSLAQELNKKKKTVAPLPVVDENRLAKEATIDDVKDLIFKLAEPIGFLDALEIYLECKEHRKENKEEIFFPSFSLESSLSLMEDLLPEPFSNEMIWKRMKNKFLSIFTQKRSLMYLRSQHTHPYHAKFFEKMSLFSNKEIEGLDSHYLKPLDLELFLRRFPALDSLGASKKALAYLLFKTKVPAYHFFTQNQLAESFFLTIKPSATPACPRVMPSLKRMEPLNKKLFQDLANCLLRGTLLEGSAIHKKWILEQKKQLFSSESARNRIFLLATLEIWIQEFIDKSPQEIAKKIFDENL